MKLPLSIKINWHRNTAVMYKIFTLLLLSSCCFVFSCQSVQEEEKTEAKFMYAELEEVKNLDPLYVKNRAEEWISGQVFNTLFGLDENLELYPVLVKTHSLSKDSLTYYFELKKNILFHSCTAFSEDSSREMTAKDVIFSFERLQKLSHKNILAKFLLQDTLQGISDTAFVWVDRYNFKINLDTIYPNFLELLALPTSRIVSQKAAKHFRRKFRTKPIGTGAFYVDKWSSNDTIILKAHQSYFKKRVSKITTIEILRVKTQRDILKKFQEEKLMMVYMDWKQWQDSSFPIIKKDSGHFENILATHYIGFLKDSLSQSNFRDKNKRIKLAYSIDYQGLINTVLPNFASLPKEGFVPPLLPRFSENKTVRLPQYFLNDSIKDELKAIYFTLDVQKSDERIARYLKKKWKKKDIYVKIRVHSSQDLQNLIRTKQSNCFLTRHQAKYADATSFFENLYPSQDSLFDSLYVRHLHSGSNQKREQNIAQLEYLIRKNALVIPLFYEKIWFNTQNHIKGFEIQASNQLQLEYIIDSNDSSYLETF